MTLSWRETLFVLMLCAPMCPAADEFQSATHLGMCGPTCVKMVLADFDIETDVYEVWRRISDDLGNSGGESISAYHLTRVLGSFGLHARTVQVHSGLPLWDHRYIAHVPSSGTTEEGHFVLIHTDARDRVTCWDPNNSQIVPLSRIDACVLISDKPFSVNQDIELMRIPTQVRLFASVFWGGITALLVLGLFRYYSVFRKGTGKCSRI